MSEHAAGLSVVEKIFYPRTQPLTLIIVDEHDNEITRNTYPSQFAIDPSIPENAFTDVRLPEGTRYWLEVDGKRIPHAMALCRPDGPWGAAVATEMPLARTSKLPHDDNNGVVLVSHVGTATEAGTYRSMKDEVLDAYVDLGANVVQLLPDHTISGGHNWGYDGVGPTNPNYGSLSDWVDMIDAAHIRGLKVRGDLVLNHIGGDQNAFWPLAHFENADGTLDRSVYRHGDTGSPWGLTLNFDSPVMIGLARRYLEILAQAGFDEVRVDASHWILNAHDVPRVQGKLGLEHIVDDAHALGMRVFLESDAYSADLVAPRERGGLGADGVYVDSPRHAYATLCVPPTKNDNEYIQHYGGRSVDVMLQLLRGELPDHEVESALLRAWHLEATGFETTAVPTFGAIPDDLRAKFYVGETHDQIGNTVNGRSRMSTSQIMGLQSFSVMLGYASANFAASLGRTPFYFFVDHQDPTVRALTTEGRKREFFEISAGDGDARQALFSSIDALLEDESLSRAERLVQCDQMLDQKTVDPQLANRMREIFHDDTLTTEEQLLQVRYLKMQGFIACDDPDAFLASKRPLQQAAMDNPIALMHYKTMNALHADLHQNGPPAAPQYSLDDRGVLTIKRPGLTLVINTAQVEADLHIADNNRVFLADNGAHDIDRGGSRVWLSQGSFVMYGNGIDRHVESAKQFRRDANALADRIVAREQAVLKKFASPSPLNDILVVGRRPSRMSAAIANEPAPELRRPGVEANADPKTPAIALGLDMTS